VNANMVSNQNMKKIAILSNQPQVTTKIPKVNVIIERVRKVLRDMLKKISMKIMNDKNVIYLIASFHQLQGFFEAPFIKLFRHHLVNLCLILTVTSMYKNGVIRIEKGIISERMKIYKPLLCKIFGQMTHARAS
jgi:hypothetical protein